MKDYNSQLQPSFFNQLLLSSRENSAMATKASDKNKAVASNVKVTLISPKSSFATVSSRGCGTNRFPENKEGLQKLYIYDDVVTYLRDAGWHDLLGMTEGTHEELTYEFVSSFEYDVGKKEISFALLKKHYSVKLDKLHEWFGWPKEGVTDVSKEAMTEVWPELYMQSGILWTDESVKAKFIRHRALFYLQKVFATTIVGRHSGQDKINNEDLVILYGCHKHLSVDWATIFARRVKDIQVRSGKIYCGCFVTRIATKLHVPLTGRFAPKKATPPGVVDQATIKASGAITISRSSNGVSFGEFQWFATRKEDDVSLCRAALGELLDMEQNRQQKKRARGRLNVLDLEARRKRLAQRLDLGAERQADHDEGVPLLVDEQKQFQDEQRKFWEESRIFHKNMYAWFSHQGWPLPFPPPSP